MTIRNILKFLLSLMLFPAMGWASTCTGYTISSCVRAENILDGDLGAAVLVHGQAAPYTFSGGSVSILGTAYGIGTQGPSSVGSTSALADMTFLVKSTSSANAHKVFAVQNNTGSELLSMSRAGTLVLSSALGSTYGGTGGNMSAATIGAVPYFSATGVMSALAAGTQNYVLQANGAGAPSFTNTPTVLGTNITGVPAASVLAGSLGTGDYTVTGKLNTTGDLYIAPATAYTSTMTAASGNFDAGGAITAKTSITATTSVSATTALAVTAGPLKLYLRTKAQLNGLTPAVGDAYLCSDCGIPYDIAVATGTGAAAGQFVTLGNSASGELKGIE